MTAPPRFSSADRHKLLHYLHGSIPLRKQRLLAIAWCRRITHLIPEHIGHTALEAAAQLAEGRPVASDVERLADHLNYRAFSYIDGCRRERELNIASDALYAVYYALQPDFERVRDYVSWAAAHARCPQLDFPAPPIFAETVQEEQAAMQPQLLDVFGNAYQSVTLAPRWRTTNVHELARTIYDEERGLSTMRRLSTAYRFSPTRSKTPAARTPTSSTTAASPASTCAAAGWWIWCSARNRMRAG